ncbi:MAG: hypothetical protein Q8Q01_05215 [archaeon]|nr:hypothetical protein [archaeon]
MKSSQEALASVLQSSEYSSWKEEHPGSYLSHFFCALSSAMEQKSPWEIGFYDPNDGKITIFIAENEILVKPEDQIFQKEKQDVEELPFDKVSISLDKAEDLFKENAGNLFPEESWGDGFIVLQTLQGKNLWNFTFITKSLKFINAKIDASSGEIVSHDLVEVVQRK